VGAVLQSHGRTYRHEAQGKKAKNMSVKHLKHLTLIGVFATAALCLAAPASAQKRSADRAGTGEFGLQLMDFPGVHVDGPQSWLYPIQPPSH